jgi:hypothetical protein
MQRIMAKTHQGKVWSEESQRWAELKPLTRIYLNDHRAGGTAGLRLARRMLAENPGSILGETLESLVEKIQADALVLDTVCARLGIRPNPVKRLGAILIERASALKLNGRVRDYSPLSRVLEIEALLSGIQAKRLLWSALHHSRIDDLDGFDFPELVRRADAQYNALLAHHAPAIQSALG